MAIGDPVAAPPRVAERERRVFAKEGDAAGDVAAPERILIVEDDYLVANELEATLVEAGFHVVGVAGTAEQAIRLARNGRPRLAIVDVRLIGDRDGVDAAVAMFKELGVRSIFATAHDDPETRARAKPAAPVAWLAKPYTPARLVLMIRDALSPLKP